LVDFLLYMKNKINLEGRIKEFYIEEWREAGK
jgi:hypothetical protein